MYVYDDVFKNSWKLLKNCTVVLKKSENKIKKNMKIIVLNNNVFKINYTTSQNNITRIIPEIRNYTSEKFHIQEKLRMIIIPEAMQILIWPALKHKKKQQILLALTCYK